MTKVSHGGGWHAIKYTIDKARELGPANLWTAMARKNACKTCALGMGGQKGGMRNEKGHFPEFCKKSLQAMASDMQSAIPNEIFEKHSIAELSDLTPRQLEYLGRISQPLLKEEGASHYKVINWEDALERITKKLIKTEAEKSFFYFSGRSSNEAGFLLQILARVYGSNHVNNCSYYCHQASGVGLNAALGTGTATISLDDLDKTDLLFIIGANPASNHPRLLSVCKDIRRRGGRIVVINPILETGLQKFSVPSDPLSLISPSEIASDYLMLKSGGDLALLMAIAKILIESFGDSLDQEFITKRSNGFESFKNDLASRDLKDLCYDCGISEEKLRYIASIYASSKASVFSWAMGVTHQLNGADTVQGIANLAFLRGMLAKEGAGLLPIRGHSNVQGMGSMGVKPEISVRQIKGLEAMGVDIPKHQGFDTMACMEASQRGDMDFALCLGGNLFGSNPDSKYADQALSSLDMLVMLNTTMNTGHVKGLAKETIILPVAARDEESQLTTQESMFNYVRISEGGPCRIEGVKPETFLVCDLALSLKKKGLNIPVSLDFEALRNHHNIRGLISQLVEAFEGLEQKVQTKEEFHIPGRLFNDEPFPTKDGKAQFFTSSKILNPFSGDGLRLLTIRSEGQFNTVVYEEEDRYRNQERRDVILMNQEDMDSLGLAENNRVKVSGASGTMENILVRPYQISKGSVAMYYPEANILLDRRRDPRTQTPAFKGGVVTLEAQKEF